MYLPFSSLFGTFSLDIPGEKKTTKTNTKDGGQRCLYLSALSEKFIYFVLNALDTFESALPCVKTTPMENGGTGTVLMRMNVSSFIIHCPDLCRYIGIYFRLFSQPVLRWLSFFPSLSL